MRKNRLGRSFLSTAASTMVVCGALALIAGCPGITGPGPGDGDGDGTVPAEFTAADAARGGAMYDKYWKVATGAAEPTENHPLWATRDDTTSNARTGADTWRCKECHGWDYKGVDGAYATGSHRTGFAGIFGSTLGPQEVFDLIKTDHAYGTTGLTDADIWDLAKFVIEGQIDIDDIFDGTTFTGSAAAGDPLYQANCAACHGAEGLAIPPTGPDDFDAFVGVLSNDNPWEFQHKLRFGQPGAAGMPRLFDTLTTAEIADLAAFAQTLPTEATDGGAAGDAAAGEAFFAGGNASSVNCGTCHCADASGGCLLDAPSLVGESSAEILARLDGTDSHPGGTVDGVMPDDADDVAAWLATL